MRRFFLFLLSLHLHDADDHSWYKGISFTINFLCGRTAKVSLAMVYTPGAHMPTRIYFGYYFAKAISNQFTVFFFSPTTQKSN